jgi:hypothetical protein
MSLTDSNGYKYCLEEDGTLTVYYLEKKPSVATHNGIVSIRLVQTQTTQVVVALTNHGESIFLETYYLGMVGLYQPWSEFKQPK